MIRFLQRTIRGLLCLLSCRVSPSELSSLILTINSRVTIQNSEIESRHHKKFEFWHISIKKGLNFRLPKEPDLLYTISGIESSLQHQSHVDKHHIRSTITNKLLASSKRSSTAPSSTKKDFASLKTLKNHRDIIISRSDKGSQVVMMKAEEYERKMLDLLSDPDTFHEIPTERIAALSDNFKFTLRTLKRNGSITPEQFQRFTSNLTGVPYIYGLPKTHKPHIPLRPIVAYHLSPALHLAKYLTNLLKPLVKAHNPFSVQDPTEFLTKLKSIPQPDRLIMSTFDVTSLFLCLPHSLITDGLSSLLAFSTFSSKDQKSIIDLFTICLGMNTLEFNSRSFLQIRGSPMGSPLSTIAAEIVMLGLDQWLVSKDHLGVVTWLRYVDDIFCLHRDTDHLPILTALNSYHPDLLFTHNTSRSNCIPFLDILIINTDDKFHTTVFHKPGSTPPLKPDPTFIMCSFDVTSLYLCLPPELITDSLIHFFQSQNVATHTSTTIVQLTKICLSMNTFTFLQHHYRQFRGSPMGSPLTTIIAEIVMTRIDEWITHTLSTELQFWRRYIDDIFCICKKIKRASHTTNT
ncbi:hypothetical protein LAZ67_8001879 [Cordylochernes scorpioides]|uniref:Reverse transcriptase domain-containing protein n=1 Tax=Cordylochernes scorpioides TaxID=51811 RepID=A0ABY6KTD6_9ARAC|nr:hypothetical protein LAZ67_8001879 [Cordylochernes scorpioides]